ncbi:MAG: class I SAM-dependent methyltransferase [Anaerolineales bacterium]|nr:class I SAM-dependent methyltransferase [Anaerolineales bacterium]
MEIIRGKTPLVIEATALAARQTVYSHTLIDLGTGDGRFAEAFARQQPDWFVIGIDACRENLQVRSRAKLPNVVYLIANALELPAEWSGLADRITINFPWGSLLGGLLGGYPALLDGLLALGRSGAGLEIRLNAGALAEAGWDLEPGAAAIGAVLAANGFHARGMQALGAAGLKAFPSTWSRRLAFGRDPRALVLRAKLPNYPRE